MSLRWPVVATLTGVWLLLWGAVTPLLVVGGVLVAVLVLVVFPFPPVPWHWTLRPWPTFLLLARFVLDLGRASVEVAWLAVRPAPPPRSAVIRVPLRTRSELLMTITAELVSLVPGSVLIETDGDSGTIWVHVLDASSPERVERARANVLSQEDRVLRALCPREGLQTIDEGGLA